VAWGDFTFWISVSVGPESKFKPQSEVDFFGLSERLSELPSPKFGLNPLNY